MLQVQKPAGGRIPSCPEEISLCSIKIFNWLGEALLPYGKQSALLKVLPFKCYSHPKTRAEKHPECLHKHLGTVAYLI